MIIRLIEASDNPRMGRIIRDVLTEFGANRPGFAWQDPELDYISEAYDEKKSIYYVIESNGYVIGGGGLSAFACRLEACCELQKMYLLPEARGKGWGTQLMDTLLQDAKTMKFAFCYLETLKSMRQAVVLYQRKGFKLLEKPLGDSGHNACDEWYLLKLNHQLNEVDGLCYK